MDKLKYVRLELEDGSYSDSIPLAVDANNVDVNGNTLINELNNRVTRTELDNTVNSIESEIASVTSGSPAGVYTTVTELTTADPDHSRIYVVSENGHWYYYNNGWQDGGLYQDRADRADVDNLFLEIDKVGENIKNLNNKLFTDADYTDIPNVDKKDNYIYSNNNNIATLTAQTNRTAVKIDITGYTKLKLHGNNIGVSSSYPVFFCRSNMSIISTITNLVAEDHWVTITEIPLEATYICYVQYINSDDAQMGTLKESYLNNILPLEWTDFIANFAENKSDSITNWINNKVIYRSKNEEAGAHNNFKTATISVQKGDLLIIDYEKYGLYKGYTSFARETNMGTTNYYHWLKSIELPYSKYPDYIQHITYIATESMDISICLSTSYNSTVQWYRIPILSKVLDIRENYTKYDNNYIMSKIVPLLCNYRDRTKLYQRPLMLLHASDPHAGYLAVRDILDFKTTYEQYIDDVLITGDIVGGIFSDYIPIYQQDGYRKFLLTMGNHDSVSAIGADYENLVPNIDKYNQYYASQIEEWDVTQPADASINGYCYYYKDYDLSGGVFYPSTDITVPKLRLIILDSMSYTAHQHSWLITTLTDAKTKGYAVVVAGHQIPMESTGDYTLFDTNFNSLQHGMDSSYGINNYSYLENEVRYKATDAIDSFINDGGEFICWLNGHMHYDMCGVLKSHPNQIFIAVRQCALYGAWNDTPAVENTITETCFNLISFDTYVKTIKVAAIGAEYDVWMRHKGSMSINYATKTLIDSY